MSDETPAGTIRRAVALMKERAEAATDGPWWSDQSDECYRLHGVAFRVPPQLFPDGEVLIPEQLVNSQILKAPKKGTPYAEYWPGLADDAHITSWHPLVALAVAEWLDAAAQAWDEGMQWDEALNVAKLYLGEAQ